MSPRMNNLPLTRLSQSGNAVASMSREHVNIWDTHKPLKQVIMLGQFQSIINTPYTLPHHPTPTHTRTHTHVGLGLAEETRRNYFN